MKNISTALKAHLSEEVTTNANCVKITLQNGNQKGFTSLDEDIFFEGLNYKSNNLASLSSFAQSLENTNESQNFIAAIDSIEISEDDVLKGLYDDAEVEIFLLNYKDLAAGKLIIKTGYIGKIQKFGDSFSAQIFDLSQKLNVTLGDFYSSKCRTKFGDTKCKIDLASYVFNSAITQVLDTNKFLCEPLTQANGYFNNGTLEFLSGANAGLIYEVADFTSKIIQTSIAVKFTVQAGDNFKITRGCDKNFSTCINNFNNAINFRAEPHLPGTDAIYKTA
jgi:uncharacterized phage protein (TIGR02218 family)